MKEPQTLLQRFQSHIDELAALRDKELNNPTSKNTAAYQVALNSGRAWLSREATHQHTGKTTRLIDEAVQQLFIHREIYVFRGYPRPEDLRGSIKEKALIIDCDLSFSKSHFTTAIGDHIATTIIQRLHNEHGISVKAEVGMSKLYIKLSIT